MEALKIVPQIFFDLIGRVVPGSVMILLAWMLDDRVSCYWASFIQAVLPGSSGTAPATTFVVLALVFAAYIVGHLISPLTKLFQYLGANYPTTLTKPCSEKYEWLRTHHQDAGAHCAKLRAEFTMYNGLAAVFFMSSVWLVVDQNPLDADQTRGLFALIVLCGFMIYRGREGRETFRNGVDKFYQAARFEAPYKSEQSPV